MYEYIQEEYTGSLNGKIIKLLVENMRNGLLIGYIQYMDKEWAVHGVYSKSTNELKLYKEKDDELLIGTLKEDGVILDFIQYNNKKVPISKFILKATD